jgi:hypothetical protein
MAIESYNFEISSSNTLTTVATLVNACNCNIYVLNKSSDAGNIRLAISSSTPANRDYVFYDFPIKKNGTLIVNDTFIAAGDKVWLYSPNNFVVRVEGEYEAVASSAATSAPTLASAATIAPTTAIAFVSGTAAIATITPPASLGSFSNRITLIPTGVFTTTAAGNIALASTAVVSRALTMTYDATTTKWYPSY